MSRSAPQEGVGDEIGFRTPSTEVASEIVTKIQKVVTPDLDDCVTMFRSITWINIGNENIIIVSVWQRRKDIVEFTRKRNTEGNDFSFWVCW
jgi:hypothetical protein